MEVSNSIINKYFDKVYVLNLEKRPDRKIAMLQKLGDLGIQAEFVQAINGYSSQNRHEHQVYLESPIGGDGAHPLEITQQRKLISSPGAWGYMKTYIGILSDAKKRGYNRILCLDDDVLFHKDFESQFKKVVQEIPDDWKLLYLGASQYVWKVPQGLTYHDKSKQSIDPNEPFYYPNNTDGSFAIGIDVSVFDVLIHDVLKMNCPFDSGPLRSVINAYPESCYVLNPNLVVADVSESDIRGTQNQDTLAEQLRWNMVDYCYPQDQDLVSVIMPAYNAGQTIEKAIRSILMQSYQTLELIVVDDASSDDTLEIVNRLQVEDDRIRVVAQMTNKGVGMARNEGLKVSKGKIIAFQDADDISLKDRLAYQLIPIYEKGMLFSVSRFYRSRCTIDELNIYDQEATLNLVENRRVETKADTFEYRDLANVGLVTCMYRRCVFEEFGLFLDLRFGEDLEFLERVLFYKISKGFDERYNGHTFLSDHKNIANTFSRIDLPLYISPTMNDENLTVQNEGKRMKKSTILQSYRNNYVSGGLEQFTKLSKTKSQSDISTLKYNTLSLNTFVVVPELEYERLLNQLEKDRLVKIYNRPIEELHNSLSWKITAPVRWLATKVLYILGR